MGKFLIEWEHGCAVVRGGIPVQAFSNLVDNMDQGAVLDADAARMADANLVIGLPEHLSAFKQAWRDEALIRFARRHPTLPTPAIQWLALGERGKSSNALFFCLMGLHNPEEPTRHPVDPADLRRCMMMLEALPALRDRLDRARDLSPQWAALLEHWGELEQLLREEMSSGSQAPKTYARMRELIDGAECAV